jgi:hypothetical protein
MLYIYSQSLYNTVTPPPARVSHHLSHPPGGGSQTTHSTVDCNPSAVAHPGPSAVVPPPTHRREARTTAPGAPPSTGVDSGNSTGVDGGDSTLVSDLPEVWCALSSTMPCPTVVAMEILFVVTMKSVPPSPGTLSPDPTKPRAPEPPIRPRSGPVLVVWRHVEGFIAGQRHVELRWARGAEWHSGIWRVIGEIDVETDVLDSGEARAKWRGAARVGLGGGCR